MSRPFRLTWNSACDVRPDESDSLVIPFRWLPVGTVDDRMIELQTVLAEAGFRRDGHRFVREDGSLIRLECDLTGESLTVSAIPSESQHRLNDVGTASATESPEDKRPPVDQWPDDRCEHYEAQVHDWQHRVTARLLVRYAARLGQIESVVDEPGRTSIVVQL